ncbi:MULTISPECIES: transposase [Sulfolobaceae]|uniref:transposase n=1 Tax=Sulfolobaceae TaxID=118883 RepID=UPI001E43D8D1|nr:MULTISPECIES: transposase [unclassified Sulfolobus]
MAELDGLKAEAERAQETEAREEVLRERERVFTKLYRRVFHYYRTLASHLAKTLWQLGVLTVYLGYPYFISQDKGNKFTMNIWSYRKLIETIVYKLYEYMGYKVFLVSSITLCVSVFFTTLRLRGSLGELLTAL